MEVFSVLLTSSPWFLNNLLRAFQSSQLESSYLIKDGLYSVTTNHVLPVSHRHLDVILFYDEQAGCFATSQS